MAKNIIFMLTLIAAVQAGPAAAQVAVSTPALTVEQAYKPVNARDPLLPATAFGDQKGTGKIIAAAGIQKGTFTVYGLTLTGIMEDSRGRQALLRDSATGALYTLRAGRLIDSKKKMMPGISGVVKGKQVILMTEDKKVHQLNLRE
jgi:hypothetical protein